MSKKLKHSKIKNTIFLHQILINQIAVDIVQSKNPKKYAYNIYKKYFNKNSILNQQYNLYKSLVQPMKSIDGDQMRAKQLVQVVLQSYNKLNKHKLNMLKYNLIKQLNQNYNLQQILQFEIDDYRKYASVYKLFQSQSGQYDPKSVLQNKYLVVQSITNDSMGNINRRRLSNKQDDTLQMIVQQFNKKYDMILNETQMTLIQKYIQSFVNPKDLLEYVDRYLEQSTKKIDNIIQNTKKNKVLKIKFTQINNKLNQAKKRTHITQNTILALIQVQQLLKEIIV